MSRISRVFKQAAVYMCGLFIVLGSFSAATPKAQAQSIAELQAIIAQLTAMLAQLLAQQSQVTTPVTGALTITAPNNGETWQIGDTHTILWAPYSMADHSAPINPASDVSAYLEKLENGRFVGAGVVVPSGKASIHWSGMIKDSEKSSEHKFANPGSYYIRIVNNKTGESDRTDKPVTLVPWGTIWADVKVNRSDESIAVPVGGKSYTVSWNSNAESCELENTSVIHYQYIDGGRVGTPEKFSNLPSSGSKTIKLFPQSAENDFFPGRVLIRCYSTTRIQGTASDVVEILGNNTYVPPVDPTLNIGSISVISPNGGETINVSNNVNVLWASNDKLSKVSIALYRNDATYKWLVRDHPLFSTGKNFYEVPASLLSSVESGSNYKIYIIGHKETGGTIEDKSDQPFSIVSTTAPVQQRALISDVTVGSATIGQPLTISWRTSVHSSVQLSARCVSGARMKLTPYMDGRRNDAYSMDCDTGIFGNGTQGSFGVIAENGSNQEGAVTFVIKAEKSSGGENPEVARSETREVTVMFRRAGGSTPTPTPTPTSNPLDVAKGTENQSRAHAIFADWQKNPSSYTEATPQPLSTGSPVHTLLRLVRECSDHRIVSKSAIYFQDGGYRNFTGGSQYQAHCINDGTFDRYYDEAKVDGASGEVVAVSAPAANTTQMASALEALRAALSTLADKLR